MNVYFAARTFPLSLSSPLFIRFHTFPSLPLTASHSSITALLKLYLAVSTLTELIKYRSISLRTFEPWKASFFFLWPGKDNHRSFSSSYVAFNVPSSFSPLSSNSPKWCILNKSEKHLRYHQMRKYQCKMCNMIRDVQKKRKKGIKLYLFKPWL